MKCFVMLPTSLLPFLTGKTVVLFTVRSRLHVYVLLLKLNSGFLPFSTTRNITLNGYFIPKDTCVFINQYQVNHDVWVATPLHYDFHKTCYCISKEWNMSVSFNIFSVEKNMFSCFYLLTFMFLSQWSLGWPGNISSWTLPGFLRTPQQGADGEGSHLRHGEETLSWWWICAFGDVCLSHHAAPRAADWKCSGAGAGSQHRLWSDYETTSVQDYHRLKVLDRQKTQMMLCFWTSQHKF